MSVTTIEQLKSLNPASAHATYISDDLVKEIESKIISRPRGFDFKFEKEYCYAAKKSVNVGLIMIYRKRYLKDGSVPAGSFGEPVGDFFIDGRKMNGGAREGAGRKEIERVIGDEPKNTTVQVEPSVIQICRNKYGSLANALRFSAKN